MKWSSAQRLACALLITCGGVSAQSSREDARSESAVLWQAIRQLQSEVARLRKDLGQIELDRHREILRLIRSELDVLQANQARLEEENRSRQQDISDVEGLLATSTLADSGRAEIQAAVSELTVIQAREIEDQKEAVRVRERELLRRLQAEEQTIMRLEEASKFLGGDKQ